MYSAAAPHTLLLRVAVKTWPLTAVVVLRGTIVNRTYGKHKNLYIQPFLPTKFGPINHGPP